MSTNGKVVDGELLFFPELPPFLAGLSSTACLEHWKAFERQRLYEEERLRCSVLPPERFDSPLTSSRVVLRSDDASRSWVAAKSAAESVLEEAISAVKPPKGCLDNSEIPRLFSENSLKVFDTLFPFGDVTIRDAEQIINSEVFCGEIALDIVNAAAEQYATRCLDAVLEGYTSLSVWEEMVRNISTSFLPIDVSGTPSKEPPTESFFAVAEDRMKANDIPPPREDEFRPPLRVPVDRYSRYILETRPGNPSEEPHPEEAKTRTKTVKRSVKELEGTKEQPKLTITDEPRSGHTPVRPTPSGKRDKKKTTQTKRPVEKKENEESTGTTEDVDPLSTALHQLPPKYFSSSAPVKRDSVSKDTDSVKRVESIVSNTKKTTYRETSNVVDINGSHLAKNKVFSSSTDAVGHKNTTYRIEKSKAPATPPLSAAPSHKPSSHAPTKTEPETAKKKMRNSKIVEEEGNRFVKPVAANPTEGGVISITPSPGVVLRAGTKQPKGRGKGMR